MCKVGCAYPVLFTEKGGVAKRVEFLLRLAHQGVQPCLHIGQLVPDVIHEDLQKVSFETKHPQGGRAGGNSHG